MIVAIEFTFENKEDVHIFNEAMSKEEAWKIFAALGELFDLWMYENLGLSSEQVKVGFGEKS